MTKLNNDLTIIGYNLFDYDDFIVEGHNCDFNYIPHIYSGHELIVTDNNGKYFSLKFKITYGECLSGWITATFAHMDNELISFDESNKVQYVPNSSISIPVSFLENDNFENNVIKFSKLNDDYYYPSGFYIFNESLFHLAITPTEKVKNET